MADVELREITKRFGAVTALRNVSFDISDGEFFVLLGPTGAGKTTTLRIISGLTRQDSGSVWFDGEAVDALTPADRDVAFVFQQYSLYPTMSVFDNLAFPLRSPLRKLSEAVIKEKVEAAAEILRIAHLLQRKTAHLSGGEMQRVSIGRAIVREPRLFLMDEPLSNLDAKLREAMRVELQHIQKVQGSTTLFVTHDQVEALTMADRIAVLDQGRIVQVGTPYDIYDRPATIFVAQLVGTPRINLLEVQRDDGALRVQGSDLNLPVGEREYALPDSCRVGVRPEDVTLNPQGEFAAEVVLLEPLGVETVLHLRTGSETLLSTSSGISHLHLGEQVRFTIKPEQVHYFDRDGNRI
jgi:multiple sugar transport system ATP-binding protein